jgi:hypothetical protein
MQGPNSHRIQENESAEIDRGVREIKKDSRSPIDTKWNRIISVSNRDGCNFRGIFLHRPRLKSPRAERGGKTFETASSSTLMTAGV